MGFNHALFYGDVWKGLATPSALMVDQDPPKIEFPCSDYPIKVMGFSGADFREYVLGVVEAHAPGFDASLMEIRDSSNGKYQSLTLRITATGPEQLSSLNTELRKNRLVKLVL